MKRRRKAKSRPPRLYHDKKGRYIKSQWTKDIHSFTTLIKTISQDHH